MIWWLTSVENTESDEDEGVLASIDLVDDDDGLKQLLLSWIWRFINLINIELSH